MQPNSSSLSMILGPPGCGKSQTIALMCMVLMHHSRVGHCRHGDTQPSVLPFPPDKLRCSDNPDGAQILVTCSSNYGVDEVAKKLNEMLPMVDGTEKRLYVVRVGRLNYNYKNLKDISLHELAMAYDIQIYNPPNEDSPQRTWASTQALQTLMKEAVVFC